MVNDPVNIALKGFAPAATFTNPWEGQGTDIGTDGPTSSPGDSSGGWWDRWGENVFNSIPDYLDSLGGMFGNNNRSNPGAQPPANTPGQPGSNNSLLWVGVAVVVVLLIILLLKK